MHRADIKRESNLLISCFNSECKANEYECSYGKCIAQSLVCDNKPDCENGEDEVTAICGKSGTG